MNLKKEHQDIFNNLDPKERETVRKMLERIDVIASKDKSKSNVYQFILDLQESLRQNAEKWLSITFKGIFGLMLILAIQSILCTAFGGCSWNDWFYNNIYLAELYGNNIFYGIVYLLFKAGVFSVGIYICAWVFTTVGLWLFECSGNKGYSYADARHQLFDYLKCREKYANLNGFDIRKEREEMKKWAKTNPNYRFHGRVMNRND